MLTNKQREHNLDVANAHGIFAVCYMLALLFVGGPSLWLVHNKMILGTILLGVLLVGFIIGQIYIHYKYGTYDYKDRS